MSIVASSAVELAAFLGTVVVGEWFAIDQVRIEAFADATEDRQWIHVDEERAQSGPFARTIAHGYLTLSLIPRLTSGHLEIQGTGMALNYGLDRVRFLQPVPSGARIRAISDLTAVDQTPRGVRVAVAVTIEIEGEGEERPALIAETLALLVEAAV